MSFGESVVQAFHAQQSYCEAEFLVSQFGLLYALV
jgi:hypothetical protein